MSESANALAARITGEATEAPNTTDPIVDEDESQEEELDTTEESTEEESTEEQEDSEEPELPEKIKDILTKNRKELREAKARATAAEKALAAKESATEEAPADSKFKELYLKSAAKEALIDAGITTGTDRFLKMLDLSGVEVDESGTVSGLEDQIADLKEEWADVLAPKPARKTIGKVDGSRREAPAVPKTSAELLASRISY